MNQTPEEVTLFAELNDNLRNGTLQKDALIQVFSQYSDIFFLRCRSRSCRTN